MYEEYKNLDLTTLDELELHNLFVKLNGFQNIRTHNIAETGSKEAKKEWLKEVEELDPIINAVGAQLAKVREGSIP